MGIFLLISHPTGHFFALRVKFLCQSFPLLYSTSFQAYLVCPVITHDDRRLVFFVSTSSPSPGPLVIFSFYSLCLVFFSLLPQHFEINKTGLFVMPAIFPTPPLRATSF